MLDSDALVADFLELPPDSGELSALRLLLELVAQTVRAEEGSLLLVDSSRDERELVFAMTVGDHGSEQVLLGQRVPISEGVTGLAFRTRQVQLGAPVYEGIRQAERGGETVDPRSVIAAPICIDGAAIGVITAVSFDAARRFHQEQVDAYGCAASIAAVLVDQQRRLRPPRHGDGDRGLEQQAIAAVRRVAERPEQLPALVRLVDALAEMATRPR